MTKQMPPIRNLSALSFQDYVRIRKLVEHDNKLPTIEVTQHDKDTVTFYDAYQAMNNLNEELQDYSLRLNEYTTNLVSALCTLLYNHNVLSKEEIEQVGDIAEKLWKDNRGN